MTDVVELLIDDLLLDQENPRLGEVSSQSEAIEKLVALNPLHFKTLMQSIKDNGLDPGDSFYVLESEEPGDYIVLDGNRRLSALIVLSQPSRLSGTNLPASTQKTLSTIAKGFNAKSVEPVRCIVFEKREDANAWIERRHTGAAGGEGRIDWGPIDIQRFKGDASTLDILDFVGRNADFSDADWRTTREAIESRKSTTLTRLLESGYGQAHLGISVVYEGGQQVPYLASEPKWALGILQKIITDIRDGIVDSRDLNKASDIEGYFKSLPSEFQTRPRDAGAARRFRDISLNKPSSSHGAPAGQPVSAAPITTGSATGTISTASTSSSGTMPASTGAKPKTKLAPKVRVTLAPKRNQFQVPLSEKGRRLLREATRLNANEFTVSCAFVLRAFVELAVSDYMQTNKLPTRDANGVELSAAQRADRVSKHIVQQQTFTNSDLRLFDSQIVAKGSATSIQSLNNFVHNKFAIPTADALRSGWDASVPVFVAAYGAA